MRTTKERRMNYFPSLPPPPYSNGARRQPRSLLDPEVALADAKRLKKWKEDISTSPFSTPLGLTAEDAAEDLSEGEVEGEEDEEEEASAELESATSNETMIYGDEFGLDDGPDNGNYSYSTPDDEEY